MSNRARVVLFAVLSLCVAFACGSSLATAQSTQGETTATGTQEETAAPSAAQNKKGKGKKGKGKHRGDRYQRNFPPEPYKNTGSNDYFILDPGYVLKLEGADEGQQVELNITVTNETELVDGVLTRVVEERETKDGKLFEISRNFFVLGQRTNNAYYFGEDVLFFDENGNVISTEGSWRSGVDGAKYGQQMPAKVREGQRYYQEIAPGVALDRAEHISLKVDVNTPAGSFRTLKVRETTPLEPKVEEFKFHARGVGLVKDGPLKLTCSGFGSTCAA